MFYCGGTIIEDNAEKRVVAIKMFGKNELKMPYVFFNIDPADVFCAIFAIFFAASRAGTAMSMGPDLAKAGSAAKTIFGIIEYPSSINAVE